MANRFLVVTCVVYFCTMFSPSAWPGQINTIYRHNSGLEECVLRLMPIGITFLRTNPVTQKIFICLQSWIPPVQSCPYITIILPLAAHAHQDTCTAPNPPGQIWICHTNMDLPNKWLCQKSVIYASLHQSRVSAEQARWVERVYPSSGVNPMVPV
jgi:hypothetical protein